MATKTVLAQGSVLRTLSHVACTFAKPSHRQWAQSRLLSLTADRIVLIGLLADAGDECEQWIRMQDKSPFDICELVAETNLFVGLVHRLFVKDRVGPRGLVFLPFAN